MRTSFLGVMVSTLVLVTAAAGAAVATGATDAADVEGATGATAAADVAGTTVTTGASTDPAGVIPGVPRVATAVHPGLECLDVIKPILTVGPFTVSETRAGPVTLEETTVGPVSVTKPQDCGIVPAVGRVSGDDVDALKAMLGLEGAHEDVPPVPVACEHGDTRASAGPVRVNETSSCTLTIPAPLV